VSKCWAYALLTVVLLSHVDAQAENVTGALLYEWCNDPIENSANMTACGRYFQGVTDTQIIIADGTSRSKKPDKIDGYPVASLYCIPQGTPFGTIRDTYLRYAEANPEKMGGFAVHLLFKALIEAYPCSWRKD
jgi:hypothetical protein